MTTKPTQRNHVQAGEPPPGKRKGPGEPTEALPETSTTTADSSSIVEVPRVATTAVVVFDWRSAARGAEQAALLQPIDQALTATGLAAELRQLVGRIGGAA
jgi:hypothetical protein